MTPPTAGSVDTNAMWDKSVSLGLALQALEIPIVTGNLLTHPLMSTTACSADLNVLRTILVVSAVVAHNVETSRQTS